jgi:hypothetical protein
LPIPVAATVVGAMAVTKIVAVAVDPHARGAGLGAALLRRTTDLYQRVGANILYGQFRADSSLDRFYTRCGFQALDEGEGIILGFVLGIPAALDRCLVTVSSPAGSDVRRSESGLARALPGCFHRKMEFDRLRTIAADYQQRHRRPAAKELRHFRILRTDEEAISKAALAQLPTGKRPPHQYRIPPAALQESERRLLGNLAGLRQAESFDHLFELIAAIIQPIRDIGELAGYNTAVRVGARFGLEPSKVYLHAGTRLGAKALGLVWRKAAIELTELPVELRTLTARELEDLLCIYKDEFGARSSRRATTSCGPRPSGTNASS